jgi:site-specific recombinase XerD
MNAYASTSSCASTPRDCDAWPPRAEHESLCQANTHWLRHTALKDLADNTDNLRYVQQIADHADIKTTMIYINAKMHELYDAIENARNQSKNRSI